jgi:hypothetical protein
MDENICDFCKKNGRCEEQRKRQAEGEIVIDYENFEEVHNLAYLSVFM